MNLRCERHDAATLNMPALVPRVARRHLAQVRVERLAREYQRRSGGSCP